MKILFLSKEELDNHPEVTFHAEEQEYQHKTDAFVIPRIMAEELCGKEVFCYRNNSTLVTKSATRKYRTIWSISDWMIKKITTE